MVHCVDHDAGALATEHWCHSAKKAVCVVKE